LSLKENEIQVFGVEIILHFPRNFRLILNWQVAPQELILLASVMVICLYLFMFMVGGFAKLDIESILLLNLG
jgi:hypothetical protein